MIAFLIICTALLSGFCGMIVADMWNMTRTHENVLVEELKSVWGAILIAIFLLTGLGWWLIFTHVFQISISLR